MLLSCYKFMVISKQIFCSTKFDTRNSNVHVRMRSIGKHYYARGKYPGDTRRW